MPQNSTLKMVKILCYVYFTAKRKMEVDGFIWGEFEEGESCGQKEETLGTRSGDNSIEKGGLHGRQRRNILARQGKPREVNVL